MSTLHRLTVPKPKAMLPKPFNIAANIKKKESIRPLAQAIGMALNQDAQYGGLKPVLPGGPEGRPNITRRLAVRVPKAGVPAPRIKGIRV